jgi:hypothetical protein
LSIVTIQLMPNLSITPTNLGAAGLRGERTLELATRGQVVEDFRDPGFFGPAQGDGYVIRPLLAG